jgi:DNA repair protein RecO (recombination protein O)
VRPLLGSAEGTAWHDVAVAVYRDEGVVLRTHKLGEADRIVTVLTRHHGRVRAVGKGVRRTQSKWGARLEPFMRVDLQLATGRTFDVVTQAVTLDAHGARIAGDYSRYTLGTAMLEAADRLVDEREPATQQYLLLCGAVRALADGTHPPDLVLDAYLLRALAIAGFAPSFADCARCGGSGPHRWFSVPSGGSVCSSCRPPGSATPAPGTLTLLAALLTGDWAAAETSSPGERGEAHGIVAAYLPWHLDRGLRSMPMVDRGVG